VELGAQHLGFEAESILIIISYGFKHIEKEMVVLQVIHTRSKK